MTNLSPPPLPKFVPVSEDRIWRDVEELPYKQRYRIKHRDKYLAQKRSDSRNRRAQKRNAGGTVTAKEWNELLEAYGNKCLSCGRDDVPMTQDHVLPLALGGTNTIDNTQPLCALCNSIKGAKHIDYRV